MEDTKLNKTMMVTAGVKDNFNQEKIEQMMYMGISFLQTQNRKIRLS